MSDRNQNSVLVLGAGASFGSEIGSDSPPLTEQLIDDLVQKFPDSWGRLGGCSRKRFRRNFETEMDRLLLNQAKNFGIWGHHLVQMQQELAIFLSSYQPSENNAYSKLFEGMKKKKWRGSIVTLNYDQFALRLLDKLSLAYSIKGFPTLENTAAGIEVIFPHGNSAFVAQGFTKAFGNIIDGDPRCFLGLNNKPMTISNLKAFYEECGQVLPAMSFISKDKHNHSTCQDFLVSQQERCRQVILDADSVIVVGVTPNENDPYLWGALAETRAKLYFCDPYPSAIKDWQATRRTHESEILQSGFHEAVQRLIDILD